MTQTERTLRRAIKGSGLGVSDLARKSGVDVGQISRFLRGERGVTLTTADALFRALGLEVRAKLEKGKRP